MRKIFRRILFGFLILLLLFVVYFFIGKTKSAKEITWGVNFSQKHTELLGLDWKNTYLALLDDLKVKNIKLITDWDEIESEENKYNFEDLDWQISEAEKRDAKILLVIGMKTGRWPECHIPSWAKDLSRKEQQKEILELLEKIVLNYRSRSAIELWQVENESFFPFGECPWVDKEFLKKEIALVKSLDPPLYNGGGRPVLISDSGEGSLWIQSARLGDIVGITMYKKVWFHQLKTYITYPFPPTFYNRKALYIDKIFGKKVIVVELQAEPWGPKLLYDSPLEEQQKTMNLEQFKYNIEFARKTGIDTFYLWGGEWWYWLKEKQNQPEIWQEAQKLFN